jgi:hypothetical protein
VPVRDPRRRRPILPHLRGLINEYRTAAWPPASHRQQANPDELAPSRPRTLRHVGPRALEPRRTPRLPPTSSRHLHERDPEAEVVMPPIASAWRRRMGRDRPSRPSPRRTAPLRADRRTPGSKDCTTAWPVPGRACRREGWASCHSQETVQVARRPSSASRRVWRSASGSYATSVAKAPLPTSMSACGSATAQHASTSSGSSVALWPVPTATSQP